MRRHARTARPLALLSAALLAGALWLPAGGYDTATPPGLADAPDAPNAAASGEPGELGESGEPGEPGAREASAGPVFTPVALGPAGSAVTDRRGLRQIAGGVELYDRATGAALRRYLPGRPATAWAHAAADRWMVALEGGEVVEVNFATEAVFEIATFAGRVHWLSVDRARPLPVLRMAIADHTVPGVGTFPLLYAIDAEDKTASVQTLEAPFGSVYEDEWGRVWLLPEPGQRLPEVRWLDTHTFRVTSRELVWEDLYGQRRYGGVLDIPGGGLYLWGYYELMTHRHLGWVVELSPPMFDDVLWQDLRSFRPMGLPVATDSFSVRNRKLREGVVTLTYDAERAVVLLRDASNAQAWAARPEMDYWVQEWKWEELYAPVPNPFDVDAPARGAEAWRVDDRPSLPNNWPHGYIDRLAQAPLRRFARLDPNRPTDALVEGLLRHVEYPGRADAVHVSGYSSGHWAIGLDNGLVICHNQTHGRFAVAAHVTGIPTAVEFERVAGVLTLTVEYWAWAGESESLRRATYLLEEGRWSWLNEEEIEVGDTHIWTDRRTVELIAFDDGRTTVVWADLLSDTERTTITPDDALHLVGLLAMPDGRVIGYGTDRQAGNDAPVLVDVTRGRRGVVWHRDYGFYAEQHPLPETGFTHAAYIPEARRVLLVADGKVWSTDRWLGDWRQELPALPAGWGEAGDGAGVDGAGDGGPIDRADE